MKLIEQMIAVVVNEPVKRGRQKDIFISFWNSTEVTEMN
jgi:hypothetical protein